MDTPIDGPLLGRQVIAMNARDAGDCLGLVIADEIFRDAHDDAWVCHIQTFPPEGNGAPIWSVPVFETRRKAQQYLDASADPRQRVAYLHAHLED